MAQVVLALDLVGVLAVALEDAEPRSVGVGDGELGKVSVGLQGVAGVALLNVVVVGGGRATDIEAGGRAVFVGHFDIGDVFVGEVPLEREMDVIVLAEEIAAADVCHLAALPVESKGKAVWQLERSAGVVGFGLMLYGRRAVEGRVAAMG